MSGPAYQYGRVLGAFQRGMEEFARQLSRGFTDAYSARSLTDEQREAAAVARYRRRIAHEREVGMAFVRNQARALRRELGLEER